jgi:hypothetical protein
MRTESPRSRLKELSQTDTGTPEETPEAPESRRATKRGKPRVSPTPADVSPPAPVDMAALVAQMRTSGLSFQQIADQLQAEGVRTLSGKGAWNKGTVAKLLTKSQTQPV